MSSIELHEMLKPVEWLVGKWKSVEAKGKFPTITDFEYVEEVEFFHVGQPNLQYSFYSYDNKSMKPLHREIGFLRLQPNTNKVAFLSAHNIGLAGVEEGEINGDIIETKTHTLGRITFGKNPETKVISRTLKKNGDKLEQILYMETINTSLTEHLKVIYERVN